jgi:Cu(I)/Ag(I) efflux system periplasmic protein CusF
MKNAAFATVGLLVALSSAALAAPSPPSLLPQRIFQRVHEGHKGATAASGVIDAVDAARRKITVAHGPIKALGWPAMTMEFTVNKAIDLSKVKAGMKVNFALVRDSKGSWIIDTMNPQ